MKTFNRFLVVLFMLVLLILSLGVAVAVLLYSGEAAVAAQSLYDFARTGLTPATRAIVAGAGGAVAGGSLVVLFFELARSRPTTVRLTQVTGGDGHLSVSAIVQRVKYEVEQLPEVRQARPIVVSHGRSVDVGVHVVLDPYADIAGKAEEVCRAVKENVQGRMGAKVRRIKVQVYHEPLAPPEAPPSQTSPRTVRRQS